MLTIYVSNGRETRLAEAIEPEWLLPKSGYYVWVDLQSPTEEEARILAEPFGFHELAIEDALKEIQTPKVESYGDNLYLILHGIDFSAAEHRFATHEVDIFLGEQFLVTVHDDFSRSVAHLRDVCPRNDFVLAEGPAALLHRIVDAMVDNYRPEVEKLETRLDDLEDRVFNNTNSDDVREILGTKRDVSSLRRVVTPQRDVVGRLARREFGFIDEQISYRFRDVYDHLVRFADESVFFQDRITSLLDANLATVSNQLNTIMKIMTIIATVFMPLTFITGLYGMNVELPHFGLSEPVVFWVLMVLMMTVVGSMLLFFRRRGCL
jgi:magnesium transporter